MSLSWTIGKLFRIPIRLHITMLIVPYFAISWFKPQSPIGVVFALTAAVALFVSILLHEFGHALTAKRFGIVTKDIILTPLGGMARVTSMPTNPKQEIAISIAGPLVSFVLGALCVGFGALIIATPDSMFDLFAGSIISLIGSANLMLAVFNMVPALPMDGGRILRGLLALKYDHLKATRLAARVGKFIAIAMGLYGALYLGQFNLVLIAIFIYFSAGSEIRMAEFQEYQRRAAQGGIPGGPTPGTYQPQGGAWKVRMNPNPGPFQAPGSSSHHRNESNSEGRDYENWQPQAPKDSDVIVVEGGKVEILGRKSDDTKS